MQNADSKNIGTPGDGQYEATEAAAQ